MSYKILIADDEPEIRELLRLYLENEKYIVIEAADGQEAMDKLHSGKPDLCILDIMMPNVDGYTCLAQIRRQSNIPVIILSAKNADSEKILGLNMGADDYLSKPFNPLEAVARVNSNIRRFYALGAGVNGNNSSAAENGRNEELVKVRDLTLDRDSCILIKGDKQIDLTSVEYKIMEMFMTHPGKVFTKQQIYECGWGEDYIIADNNIMVCISKLRSKLSDDASEYLKTIRGLGYRLEK